jgi:WD40 repeat protein
MRSVHVLALLAPLAILGSAAAQPAKAPRLDFNGDPLPDGAVARLGTLRFQPHDFARAVLLSPDGTAIVSSVEGREHTRVEFLDTATGKSGRQLELARAGSERMQFSGDGKYLLCSEWSGVKMFDARTGKLEASLGIEDVGDSAVAVTTEGGWVAAQLRGDARDAPVLVWDTKTGKEVATLPGRGAWCKGLAFGPGGKRLLLRSVVPTKTEGGGMSYGPESKVALACIDVEARNILGEAQTDNVKNVALGPDGETVALETADRKGVRVLHLATGAERCTLPVKHARLAFAPDGKSLLTVDEDRRAALWDAAKGSKIRDLDGALVHEDFRILGISKDGKTVAVLDGGWRSTATVVIWDATTGKRRDRPPGHDGAVTCLAYAPAGKLLASGGLDKTVHLWDPTTGRHVRDLAAHKETVTAVAFSPDGKLVASSCESGLVRVSDATGKSLGEFAGPEKGATALAFSRDGSVLYAGGNAPLVLGWRLTDGKEVVRLNTGQDGAVMAFGGGGALALTANGEIRDELTGERLRVWDTGKKQPVASLPIRDERSDGVGCPAATFSPDGRLLASSQVSEYQGVRPFYGNAMLRLWERASGQPIRTLAPAVTRVLAFSPDGRFLAGGAPGTSGHLRVGYGPGIEVWDALTGEKVASLHVTPNCIAFNPDGRHLATGGRDHTVLTWEAPKPAAPRKGAAPSAAKRDAWWAALAGDAKEAYQAVAQMLDDPDHAVATLKERVQPVRLADADTVARLVKRFDSDAFADREEAQLEIEKFGEGARHLLLKALERDLSPEAQRRVQAALGKTDETSPATLREHRAIAALEWAGTADARALLRDLAGGTPRARLTTEAAAALKRLDH